MLDDPPPPRFSSIIGHKMSLRVLDNYPDAAVAIVDAFVLRPLGGN